MMFFNPKELTVFEAVELSRASPWHMHEVALSQRNLVEQELMRWSNGEVSTVFQAFADLVKQANPESLLEVGCGVGHYCKILSDVLPGCRYEGLDASAAMSDVRIAGPIFIGDATRLPWKDSHFDCVVEGCVIIHELCWKQALSECCRVAKSFVILHRTPLTLDDDEPTLIVEHEAYGHRTFAVHYQWRSVLWVMRKCGFALDRSVHLPVASHYRMKSSLWSRTSSLR